MTTLIGRAPQSPRTRPSRAACIAPTVLLAFAVAACRSPTPAFEHRTLAPFRNPYRDDPTYRAQPHRDRPLRVAVAPDGSRAYVTLQGLEDEPGHEVAVVDLRTNRVVRRVEVGSSPTGVAFHPGGRFVFVTNRYSNWSSVIDATTDAVVLDVPVEFYATDVVFTPDGQHVYLTNRWRNHVVRLDVRVTGDRFEVTSARASVLSASTHPRDLAISQDGSRLAVAGLDGLHVHLYELPSERLVSDVWLNSPVNDVVFAGVWLFALTQGPGDGHPPLLGPDADRDGRPGDSTANSNFQDQQNDIAVIRASDGHIVRRYSSDTTCCMDFRDVRPEDPLLGTFLPPREDWIVGGAVPEAGALCGPADAPTLWVAYLGSSEVEGFRVDLRTGTLQAAERGRGGFGLTHIACAPGGAVVVAQLGESVQRFERPSVAPTDIVVGDTAGGSFPSTDSEVGELVNVVTAPFTVDGDQSCVMCHREFGNVERAFSMPLLRYPEGTRLTMAHRGLSDTRPWFFETAMDENNFFPVLNEFARTENFCCTSLSLWTTTHPAPIDCAERPPPECAGLPWPHQFATRNAFYEAQALHIIGRVRSFGDTFDSPLNFQGLTHALGVSLLTRSRMLPNPNPADTADVRRGRGIFASAETGCATCHFGPGLAASLDPENPFVRLRFGPVITPLRAPDGRNLDLITDGFLRTFPDSVQDGDRIEFGVPMLRGIWARSNIFLHDGRARNLREVLATPGHRALRPGERGFNEVDGVPDSHGATSHLSGQQIDDLIAFLLSQ